MVWLGSDRGQCGLRVAGVVPGMPVLGWMWMVLPIRRLRYSRRLLLLLLLLRPWWICLAFAVPPWTRGSL